MKSILSRFIATCGFSGYAPTAPGTAGTLLAAAALMLIPALRGVTLLIALIPVFFLGVLASSEVEKTAGHDASIINVDEWAGMWVTALFIPSGSPVWVLIPAFLLFRVMDVWKPFPVNHAQGAPGGWGVMLDDVLAGVYAGLILRLGLFFIL